FSGRPATVPAEVRPADDDALNPYGDARSGLDAVNEIGLPAPGEEREYYGHFFVQNQTFLRGWAAARSKPSESLRVSIVVDDVEIGAVLADRPRANLKHLFGDDIHHGFEVQIPPRYYDGKPHQAAVLAPDGDAIGPRRSFTVAPETIAPEIKIIEVSPSEISGLVRVSPDTIVNRNLLCVWLRGERLPPNAVRLNISDDGEGPKSFRLTFPRLTIADLLRDDAHIGLMGGFEVEEGIRLRDALGISIVRGWNNVLTVSSRVLLPETLTLGLKLAVYFGARLGTPAVVADVDLSLGSDEVVVDGAPDGDIYAAIVTDGDETPWAEPERLPRRLGELVVDPTFRDWTDGAPRSWAVGKAVDEVFQSYYAFSHETLRQYGLSGNLIVLKCPEGRCDGVEILRQAISCEAVERLGPSLLFGLAARATGPFDVTVELGDQDGSIASATFGIGTDWSFVTRPAVTRDGRPPARDCFVRVLLTGNVQGGDTWCEFAGLACGEQAVFRRKSAATRQENVSENLIENAHLSSWPNGLDFSQAMGRFQTAAGWFVYNKRSLGVPEVSLRPAKPLPGHSAASSGRYALGISASDVPNYCRLEIRTLRVALEELADYTLSFVASADVLSPTMKVDRPQWTTIDRLFLLRRTTHLVDGGKEARDARLAAIGSRVLVTKSPQKFTFGAWTDMRDEAVAVLDEERGTSEDFIVVEFNEPFAICLQGIELIKVPKSSVESRLGELSFEDGNITAQIPYLEDGPYLRALKGVVEGDIGVSKTPAVAGDGEDISRWSWRYREFGSIDVIVCMHDAVDETLDCLKSLCRASSVPHGVCVIDDASSIVAHNRVCEFIRDKPWMRIVRNAENIGYTRSANRGIYASEADWVVLLNSDTIVTRGWLEGMLECAASHPNTACVGPVSNAATYQSVPEVHDVNGKWCVNELPAKVELEEVSNFIRTNSLKAFPSVPLLNGFCTLIKREIFVDLGGFNEAAFPAGYGEENDLCARVTKAGYRLSLADHVYVYHHKSASFGSGRRKELAKAGSKALHDLHPDVDFTALGRRLGDTAALAHLRDRLRTLYRTA
ncbi:MAG: glycosyltransferase family 2 protein, partial [Rhizomicrobium sp.]